MLDAALAASSALPASLESRVLRTERVLEKTGIPRIGQPDGPVIGTDGQHLSRVDGDLGNGRDLGNGNIIANSFYQDGRPGVNDLREWSATTRLTAQLSPRDKLAILADRRGKFNGHEYSSGTDVQTASYRREPVQYQIGVVKWTSPVTSRLMLEAGYGLNLFAWNRKGQPGVERVRGTPEWFANASHVDIIRSTRTTTPGTFWHDYPFRYQVQSALSYVTGAVPWTAA